MSTWVSVDDRLPIDQDYKATFVGRDVLITDGYRVEVCEFQMGGNHVGKPWRSFSTLSGIERSKITHWCEIPSTIGIS